MRHALRLGRAVNLVRRSVPAWTAVSMSLLLVQGLLPLAALYLVKLIVDAVADGMAVHNGADFGRIALLIACACAVALLGALCRSLAGLASEAQSQAVTDHVHHLLHAKSVEVDLEYYENPQYYDTLHRAQQEAPFRPTSIVNGLAGLGRSGISLLAMAGLLLSFSWVVAVILFAAAVPGVLVRLAYSGRMYRWHRRRTPAERRTWYLHRILTGKEHAKEIRLFGLGDLFMSRFRDMRVQLRGERLGIAAHRSLAELAAQTGAVLAIFGSLAFIAYRTVQGSITIGDMVMYYGAFQRGQSYLGGLLGSLAGLYEDNLFLSSLDEFLELQPGVVDPPRPRPLPRPLQSGICFEGVSFSYPGSSSAVLEDICFKVRPGEVVALVGRNGAGKTTIVKLLCRLYDPAGGRITLDGTDIREYKVADFRREIGVVLQDYAHYDMSARENIWLGDVRVPPDQERIIDAARRSGAHEVIESLPRGYETVLGKRFEEGEELSIGEWQKMALARAFLREAQIIVLDEPTAALDAQAEYEIFEKFSRMVAGRAAILISHRFSTVRMADRIYVIDGGRIVESGTHDELLDLDGGYARLFRIQASSYR